MAVALALYALAYSIAGAGDGNAAPGSGPIVLQERYPLAFLLSTPTGEIANISSSDTIRMVSEIIDRHTNFFLEIAEAQVVTDCRGRLACLVRHARPDYNRETMLLESGTVIPFSEHIRDLRQRKAVYPRFMLILSNVTLPGQADRLSAVLLDTDIALEYFHSASRDDPEWERDTDARINEHALIFGPQRAQVTNPQQARDFVQDLFSKGLAPVLEQNNHWDPYGSIELTINAESVAINLDGVPIGTTRPGGVTRIDKVTSGLRRLSIEDPAYESYVTDVDVPRNQTARAEITLKRRGAGSAPMMRSAVFWSGATLAAVGTGLTVWATIRKDSAVTSYCFDAPGTDCRSTSQFQTLNYDPEAAAKGDDPNPGGLLLGPFGYSLAIAGVAWAVGTYLIGDETDVPWVQLLAGVVLGAASYSVSTALDPR